ncbi:uncharacterized protein LOC123562707 [Mercenaria mercenaria]|uniref:uncharacterized protein LOC123562707 n=1 Tax=Mercenaria mercenaria TaxID=6596 RepID=UPI00234E9A98|nr:uncharacterized protein LOC123562707 [Mercenaria mercenaria]
MSLIGADDISTKWCVVYKYSENGQRWPKAAQCLVKCELQLKKKKKKKRELEWNLITGNSDVDCWQKFSNQIFDNKKKHAEVSMIEDIGSKIEEIENERNTSIRKCEIEVAINYSPCNECSEILISLKKGLEKKGVRIRLKITFANFYGCQRSTLKKNCIPGLVKLLQNDIKLNVFSTETWDWLLHDVLCLKKSRKFQYLLDDDDLDKRKEREEIDYQILRGLKKIANGFDEFSYLLDFFNSEQRNEFSEKLMKMVKSKDWREAKQGAKDFFSYTERFIANIEE